MNKPSVLIWGCGSIGMRHASLALELGASVFCISSRNGLPFPSVKDFRELPANFSPDVAIIATPTALHAAHVRVVSSLAPRLTLVEKPLVKTATEIGPWLTDAQRRCTLVAYNLRFHPGVQDLQTLLKDKKLLALQLHVGQYLPSWRPNQDYRQCYSAFRGRGGGVLRDLSHELDLACLFAGPWRRVAALVGKLSSLDIESDDTVTILAEHEGCPQVSIHLDYLQSPARREIVAILEGGGIYLNLLDGTLHHGEKVKIYRVDGNTSYRLQMQAVLAGKTEPCCTFSQGLDVVSYVDAVERAAAQQEWIWRANQ
ncbi:Gfo/Idh/MocA family protein [Desulfovibrio legallii]|uniref:Predicted dehydrogenase n=1 Tax=Desulfovibrio legallii TaxID=571438 RepID=A0A1G7J7K2_9BACT|nr:Gfo/Idh/MocA family oxidoreductase [Desulfovibrio legallii]SDF20977.1 Predicted dehydrogenase [Desulfovibrio legallii]